MHVTELSPAKQTPDSQNVSHGQRTSTKSVRVLPYANILYVPLHELSFHDHGEGIHTLKPHWKGIYSKHFSFRSSKAKFAVNYSKDKTNKESKKTLNPEPQKSTSTCALCTQQFQILPLSSILEVYINTRAHPAT